MQRNLRWGAHARYLPSVDTTCPHSHNRTRVLVLASFVCTGCGFVLQFAGVVEGTATGTSRLQKHEKSAEPRWVRSHGLPLATLCVMTAGPPFRVLCLQLRVWRCRGTIESMTLACWYDCMHACFRNLTSLSTHTFTRLTTTPAKILNSTRARALTHAPPATDTCGSTKSAWTDGLMDERSNERMQP